MKIYPRYKLMDRYRGMGRAEYTRRDEVTITDKRIQIALETDKPLNWFKIGTETIPVILIPTYWNDKTQRYELGKNPVEDIREWGGQTQTPMDLATELQSIMGKQETGNSLLSLIHNALRSVNTDKINVVLTGSDIVLEVDTSTPDNIKSGKLIGADLTTAQELVVDTQGNKLVDIYAKSTAPTTFHLDVSPDNDYWISNYNVWDGVSEVKYTMWCGFRYVRIRSDTAGAAGDTVDLIISSKP